jgi:hypothetical protein
MIATGFKGASNRTIYEVKKDGQPFDLVAAGVVKIEVVEAGQVLSSATGEVSFSGAVINVEWGAFALDSGTHNPTIYAYKNGDTKGEVLFGPHISPLMLTMLDDERP